MLQTFEVPLPASHTACCKNFLQVTHLFLKDWLQPDTPKILLQPNENSKLQRQA